MRDPTALWLTLTNILLGVLVIAALIYVVSGPLRDKLARLKKRRGYEAEVNHDMEEMFAGFSRAAVEVTPAPPGVARKIRMRLERAWRRTFGRR